MADVKAKSGMRFVGERSFESRLITFRGRVIELSSDLPPREWVRASEGKYEARPIDPYDLAWPTINETRLTVPRSVGAAATGEGATPAEADSGQEGAAAAARDAAGADQGQEGQKDQSEDKGADGAEKAAGDDKGNGADATPPWYEGIKDEKALDFAKRFPTLNDFSQETLKFRQQVSTRLAKPGKDASDEDVAAWRKAIGVPDEPSGYEFKLPDDVPEEFAPGEENKHITEAFQKTFHDLGLSKEQGAGLIEFYYRTLLAQEQAREKDLQKTAQKQRDALDTEWGNDAARNKEVAVRAVEVFGGSGLVDLFETAVIDGIPLGDHPAVVKAFAKIGLQMQEADPLLGTSQEERDSLQEQHADLTAQIIKAHDDGDRALVQRLEAKRTKISEKIAGNVPIVGTGGRQV